MSLHPWSARASASPVLARWRRQHMRRLRCSHVAMRRRVSSDVNGPQGRGYNACLFPIEGLRRRVNATVS